MTVVIGALASASRTCGVMAFAITSPLVHRRQASRVSRRQQYLSSASIKTGSSSALFASLSNTPASDASPPHGQEKPSSPGPLYLAEGLFAVDKPVDWTSQDVVAFVRARLERDARKRGAKPRKQNIKVGHGGTLDPLATGVLVIGVGRGTKELQSYLEGSKRYRAGLELGYETTTLDLDGNVTERVPFDHATLETLEAILPDFTGTISQIPPVFSTLCIQNMHW